ncbi:MAG: tRNA (N6-threonylcarbamoyladenosine(37)-N6)-methyltransferase TrmO [Candidatus Marinimicrobia bacterium]|nr:tRNA (N6-threonylcarbamoyladenosine(37)-N6)-methyltransferase TrmO [Candidatus Neomarinimicrobiota bacterium]
MKNKDKIIFRPIGIIHSPFKTMKGTPIQSTAVKDAEGTIEIYTEFVEGLRDLDGFSHIQLLFYFHLSKKFKLEVMPYMDDKLHGVFSTRAPSRPNNIGLSVVRLIKIEGNILHIKNIDMIEGTPLIDIKPFVSKFDNIDVEKIGWLENKIHKLSETKDDERFVK